MRDIILGPTVLAVLPYTDCFETNVDTKKALVALNLLLRREARVSETPLLIQLEILVFDHNYLSSEFSPDIFHKCLVFLWARLLQSR